MDSASNGFARENLPKLIFSFFFLMVNMMLFMYAAYMVVTDFHLSWLGAFIGLTSFMWTMGIIFFSARTSRFLPVQSTLVVGGTAISLYAYLSQGDALLAMVTALYLFITWIGYIFWYSNFTSYKRDRLAVGNEMPQFELENIDGQLVSEKDFIGKKTLYLFYRGNWCPLCMTQVKEIAEQYKELANRGVVVNLVSTQKEKFTRQLAKKYDVPFNYLIDRDAKMALDLKIFQKNIVPLGMQMLGHSFDAVTPVVIITDEQGKIIFSEIADNYRLRPEPGEFLKVLDEYQGVAA